MISRRVFHKHAVNALTLGISKPDRIIPAIGVTGYSFQHLSLDDAIAGMVDIGLNAWELWFRHLEPKLQREELRAWRLSVPLEFFQTAAQKIRSAGIRILAYTFDMKEDFTSAELTRVFEMATALKTPRIATSTTFAVVERILPLMEEFKIEVAFHGHKNANDPNQFAGPDSFRRVLGMSRYARINLDIGQFVAAGFDPLPFIQEQHENIPLLHLRDGNRKGDTKLAWGTGETPIKEVLALLNRNKYPIAADIECDYKSSSSDVTNVRTCYDFCRRALRV